MIQYLRNLWLFAHVHWLWSDRITYRPGWTPLRFLFPYLTTYLLSTLLGHCIRPFSGVVHLLGWRWLERLIDAVLGEGHCAESARRAVLWGSRSVWR